MSTLSIANYRFLNNFLRNYLPKRYPQYICQQRNLTNRNLNELYASTKRICLSKKPPQNVNSNGVFACNELDLKEISVYGFDYDFTLACYKPCLDYLLYDLGKDILIKKFMYPKEISTLEYQPDFAIRGLHYDIEKGLLMKLDSFLQIQLGTVYRGKTPLPDDEVLKLYKNRIIPVAYVEGPAKVGGKSSKLHQLADLFAMPEMGLICNITEYFKNNHIDYHPEILFRDVRSAVGSIHPVMHREVFSNPQLYLDECKPIREFFTRLVRANKKLFLITNSPFQFVDKGMSVIIGTDWSDFFHVIIVQARKPKFFTDESRPLRMYDKASNTLLWDRVTKIQKGVIYCEGTITNLQEMTGWTGDQVLYFGDHPYSDLADATLEHGWRTGAIIDELTHEIEALNNPEFKQATNWCHMLTQLIEECQDNATDVESQRILETWIEERNQLLEGKLCSNNIVATETEFGKTRCERRFSTAYSGLFRSNI